MRNTPLNGVILACLLLLLVVPMNSVIGQAKAEATSQESSQGEGNFNNQQYEDNLFNHQDDSIYAGGAISIKCHTCDFGSDEANARALEIARGQAQQEDNTNNQQHDKNFLNQQVSSIYSDKDVTIECRYIGGESCRPQ